MCIILTVAIGAIRRRHEMVNKTLTLEAHGRALRVQILVPALVDPRRAQRVARQTRAERVDVGADAAKGGAKEALGGLAARHRGRVACPRLSLVPV